MGLEYLNSLVTNIERIPRFILYGFYYKKFVRPGNKLVPTSYKRINIQP